MDKLFETVLKILPSDTLPLLAASGVAFFGVYYYYGLRNYTDVLHHRMFLSIIIVLVGVFLIKHVNTIQGEIKATRIPPLLLIPEFEDDERGAYKTLFIQQVQSALQDSSQENNILALNTYIKDKESAQLTATQLHSSGIIYSPRIIRMGDKILVCFHLFIVKVASTKTYPPSPIELGKDVLSDIADTLKPGDPSVGNLPQTSLLARLNALEQRVAALQVAATRSARNIESSPYYNRKYALVVGLNDVNDDAMPKLQYAESDAHRLGDVLKRIGFDVTLLIRPSKEEAENSIANISKQLVPEDLLLIYYSGATFALDDSRNGVRRLIMPVYDFKLSEPSSGLSLDDMVDKLIKAVALHKLLIIDGCHGTSGLESRFMAPVRSTDELLQIYAGSQDTEYGLESSQTGGGAFTYAIIRSLQDVTNTRQSISLNQLATGVTRELVRINITSIPNSSHWRDPAKFGWPLNSQGRRIRLIHSSFQAKIDSGRLGIDLIDL